MSTRKPGNTKGETLPIQEGPKPISVRFSDTCYSAVLRSSIVLNPLLVSSPALMPAHCLGRLMPLNGLFARRPSLPTAHSHHFVRYDQSRLARPGCNLGRTQSTRRTRRRMYDIHTSFPLPYEHVRLSKSPYTLVLFFTHSIQPQNRSLRTHYIYSGWGCILPPAAHRVWLFIQHQRIRTSVRSQPLFLPRSSHSVPKHRSRTDNRVKVPITRCIPYAMVYIPEPGP